MEYKLHSPYQPTGDQPQPIDQLVQGVLDGTPAQTLLGVTGSGKTFTMANVIARTGRCRTTRHWPHSSIPSSRALSPRTRFTTL